MNKTEKAEAKGMKALRIAVAAVAVVIGLTQLVRGVDNVASSVIPDAGQPAAPIAVQKIALANDQATDFGRYTARGSNVVQNGTGFFIYAEPANLSTRFEDGRVKAQISVDVMIRNAQGEAVIADDNVWQVPLEVASNTHRSVPRSWVSLEMPSLELPNGRYAMTLRFHDVVSGTFVDQTLELEYRQAAPAPQAKRAAAR